MNLEEFCQHYEERTGDHPKRQGAGYQMRCPVHEDKQASLNVREGEDGTLLLKCYADCETADVLASLGLSWPDLFPRSVNYAEPEQVYLYVDELGNNLFEQVRFPGKKFRARHLEDGEWVWNLDGVRRVLYRLPEVIEGVKAGRTIYVVEGEKDVENLRASGVVATCNPSGAGKWRPEFAAFLEGANVVVVADRDEPGRAHARAVRESLQGVAKAIWVVQPRTGKDASDHLTHGHRIDEFVPLKDPIRRGLVTARELAELAMEDLQIRSDDMPMIQPWSDGALDRIAFRPGRAYAIGAYTGDGKTSAALQAFRKLATEGRRCGYHSLEMPERDLRNKLIAHTGIPYSVLEQPWQIRGSQWEEAYMTAVAELGTWEADIVFDSQTTAEKISDITLDREHDIVFVDHLHRFAWGQERRKLDEQVNRLTNLALEQNVVLIVLCQLRKYNRGKDMVAYPRPLLQDFRETSMIGDDASMALAIWRQRDAAGFTYTGETELIILKNRHTTAPHDAAGVSLFPYFDQQRGMFIPRPTWEEQNYDS